MTLDSPADGFAVDTSLLSTLDRPFLALLAASIAAHLAVAVYLHRQPTVALSELDDAVSLDRFEPARLPPLLAIPRAAPPVMARAALATPRPSSSGSARAPVPVSQLGLLKVLGSVSATSVTELLSPAAVLLELPGQARLDVASAVGPAQRRAAAAGETATIGTVGTQLVPAMAAPERADAVLPPSRLEPVKVELDDQVVSAKQLQRFIALRKSALQSCYERELKRQGALSGKLVVKLTLATNGRARAVEVADEGLGSAAVASCVRTLVERWAFPVAPETEVPVSFPLLFSPAL